MSEFKFELERVPASVMPLSFEVDKCVGCLKCVEACQIDVLVPPAIKGETPRVMWPGECWYCGACVMDCPTGAIKLRHPLMNQASFIEKSALIGGKDSVK